jgi:hypothetical protein
MAWKKSNQSNSDGGGTGDIENDIGYTSIDIKDPKEAMANGTRLAKSKSGECVEDYSGETERSIGSQEEHGHVVTVSTEVNGVPQEEAGVETVCIVGKESEDCTRADQGVLAKGGKEGTISGKMDGSGGSELAAETMTDSEKGAGGGKDGVTGIENEAVKDEELIAEEEDGYATFGEDQVTDTVAETEGVGLGIDDSNETFSDPNGTEKEEDDYSTIGADQIRARETTGGVALERDNTNKATSGVVGESTQDRRDATGRKPAEVPKYAEVDMSKKKRSKSDKTAAVVKGLVNVLKFSSNKNSNYKIKVGKSVSIDDSDVHVYDKLDRSKGQQFTKQNSNYAEVTIEGGATKEETMWNENDIYSPTPPDWRGKGSAADDGGAQKGVTAEGHNRVRSDSDDMGSGNGVLGSSFERKGKDPDYESFDEGEDANDIHVNTTGDNVENKDLKPEVPNRRPENLQGKKEPVRPSSSNIDHNSIDPDYASMDVEEEEKEEEDHYATVDNVGDRVCKVERSSSVSGCDEEKGQ